MDTLTRGSNYNLKPWLITNSSKVSVIFPVHGPETAISDQIGQLFSLFLPNLHVIALADSRVSIRSMATLDTFEKFKIRLKVIQRQPDDPIGVGILEGIAFALEDGVNHIIQLSQYSEDEINSIPVMLRYAEHYDLIVGSRFLVKQQFICPQKQFQYKIDYLINQALLKPFMGGKLTDATSSVRCWSRMALDLVISRLKLRNPHLLNFELSYLSNKYGLRMKEIPIDYKPTVLPSLPVADTSPLE